MKLKLNKRSLLFLAIAIFAILGISLSMAQSRQTQEQGQLEQDLSLAQSRLNKVKNASESLSSRQKELETRLVQATSQLTAVKAELFHLIETIEVDDTLFDIAETSGVEITEISSSAPADKELKGVPCSVLTVKVRVKGDITNLNHFVLKLTEEFHTGVVISVEITLPKGSEGGQPSANLNLLIYTYRGDQL